MLRQNRAVRRSGVLSEQTEDRGREHAAGWGKMLSWPETRPLVHFVDSLARRHDRAEAWRRVACNTNTTRLKSSARVSGSPGRDGAAARYVSVAKRLFTRC